MLKTCSKSRICTDEQFFIQRNVFFDGSKYESEKKGKGQESIQLSTTPDPGYELKSDKFTISRLWMSVTTQGGSGRQYVTGPGGNISEYRLVLLNVYRFRET